MITPALMVRAQCNRRFTQLDSEFNVYMNGTSIFEAQQSMFISKVDNGTTSTVGLDLDFRSNNRLDNSFAAGLERRDSPRREDKKMDGTAESGASDLRLSSEGRSTGTGDTEDLIRATVPKGRRRNQLKQLQHLRMGGKKGKKGYSSSRSEKILPQRLEDASEGEDRRRRRLAAIEKSGFLGAIKDKNWSPFFYRGRMLWSYMLHPHIVCEFEQEMDDLPAFFGRIEPDDCILCMRRFATNNTALIDQHSRRYGAVSLAPHLSKAATVMERGSSDQSPTTWHYHFNGVQAFRIEDEPFFLGVCHSISETWKQVERMQHYQRLRSYVHYFYKMEIQPPFRILAISKVIPLLKHRAVSS